MEVRRQAGPRRLPVARRSEKAVEDQQRRAVPRCPGRDGRAWAKVVSIESRVASSKPTARLPSSRARCSLLAPRHFDMTPMMQQYFEVKRGLPPGTLLLFRLGDFFEMFFEDAAAASRLLGLTLTKRQDAPDGRHSAPRAGQLREPAAGRRPQGRHLRPAGAGPARQAREALADPDPEPRHDARGQPARGRRATTTCAPWRSTGASCTRRGSTSRPASSRWPTDPHTGKPPAGPRRARPARGCCVPEGAIDALARRAARPGRRACPPRVRHRPRRAPSSPPTISTPAAGARTVMDTLGVLNLEGFGLSHTHPGLGPAGALVYYATENLCAKPENLRTLQEYRSAQHPAPRSRHAAQPRDLPVRPRHRATARCCGAIDRTVTAAGARLLERWLAAPPLDLPEIRGRQTARRRTARRNRPASAELRGLLAQRPRHSPHPRPPAEPPAQSRASSAACRTPSRSCPRSSPA